ncbi:MAG: geranylgeranylglycerol-phosphate geranylgeranyltransferase [Bacteroidia bacterium]|jgi:4-hydroxybenzoate polyprenyltransferase|nr:geranylgeranylglycerol-phosphate geranylgeranyltransferase [Bacteroidia bacterium]
MFHFLRLFRPLNLLLIALTQFLVRYCLILPAFQTEKNVTGEFPAHLDKWTFCLLVFSTVLIAAGGNVINDVYDRYIDEKNRPGTNPIGSRISPELARKLFMTLSVFGCLTGFLVALRIGRPGLGLIQVFCAYSLYMYASQYKRKFIIGNILIAFLSALVPLTVALYEPEFYRNIIYVLVYALFAFLISLVREILKDAEDLEGDRQGGCDSIPVRYGLPTTRIIATGLILVTGGVIAYLLYHFFNDNTVVSLFKLEGIFLIPLAGLLYLVLTAKEKSDFHYTSVFAKAYLAIGILSMIPFYFYFLK